MATTPQGYADIWRYLRRRSRRHRGGWNRPVDDPLLVLVAEPRRLRFGSATAWVRLVDIPAALSARRYMSDGRIVFEVSIRSDPTTTAGTSSSSRTAPVRAPRTDDKADLAGTVNVLGATYLGGTTFGQLAADQVEERIDGASRARTRCSAGHPRRGRRGTSDLPRSGT